MRRKRRGRGRRICRRTAGRRRVAKVQASLDRQGQAAYGRFAASFTVGVNLARCYPFAPMASKKRRTVRARARQRPRGGDHDVRDQYRKGDLPATSRISMAVIEDPYSEPPGSTPKAISTLARAQKAQHRDGTLAEVRGWSPPRGIRSPSSSRSRTTRSGGCIPGTRSTKRSIRGRVPSSRSPNRRRSAACGRSIYRRPRSAVACRRTHSPTIAAGESFAQRRRSRRAPIRHGGLRTDARNHGRASVSRGDGPRAWGFVVAGNQLLGGAV